VALDASYALSTIPDNLRHALRPIPDPVRL
jgi:hypothetical protein